MVRLGNGGILKDYAKKSPQALMLETSVEVWRKNILYHSNEGQTHFNTSWYAKMSLTLI